MLGKPDRYLVIPEPNEELEGSELTEGERYQAMLREKTRREGRVFLWDPGAEAPGPRARSVPRLSAWRP